jgi:hypothetical protein
MILEIIDAKDFDFHQMHQLMKIAFEERKSSSVEIPSAESLEQKYCDSPQASKIAAVKSMGRLIAINGLLPIETNISLGREISWMSCDTATHPEFRGLGLFKKCILGLEETLQKGDLICGFPNENSLPGFVKFGWKPIKEINLFYSSKSLLECKDFMVTKADVFNEDMPCKFDHGINKSSNYLNWRYNKIRSNYLYFQINYQGESLHVVGKKFKSSIIEILVILEVFSTPKFKNEKILQALRNLAHLEKTSGLLLGEKFGKLGPIKVPHFVNKRPIIFAGKRIGLADWDAKDEDWNLSLGDFDAL